MPIGAGIFPFQKAHGPCGRKVKLCLVMCPGDEIFCQCFTTGRLFLVYSVLSVKNLPQHIWHLAHGVPHFLLPKGITVRALLGLLLFQFSFF
jgi:hypothetical protein